VHSERLSRLATSLLVLARLQTGVEQPRLTVVPVRPLLEEIAGRLDSAAGVEVSVRAQEQTGALADRDLLHRAIANVAENSAKHTQTGEIVLEARGNATTTQIEIRDTGPGMSEEERERAFHRFYRSSNGTDGFGLGSRSPKKPFARSVARSSSSPSLVQEREFLVVVPSAKLFG
jgi:signal transduction histidine kinase